MTRIALSFLLLFAFSFLKVAGNDISMAEYAENQKEISDSVFYAQFPYEKFAVRKELLHLKQLTNCFLPLQKLKRDPAQIIEGIFNHYLDSSNYNVFSFEQLTAEINLGERYLHSDDFIEDSTFIFRTFGDNLLSKVTERIQQGLDAEEVDKSTFEYRYLHKRLTDNQYRLDPPMSDVEKGVMHVQKGNFGYVLKRIWTDHKWLVISGLIVLLVAGWWINSTIRKKRA